ncbi:uracil phosphoribosyltransferase [Mycobacterium adipatum]|uniref:Uracil phosphoribosyltransferase n=1 Tax=Mycobacterium adipatum TaxID=1682113 RepID=A0A172UKB6_9MYCO|nr:URC4/urg3 family protein [Mycobacterium adipatum]ANE79411.1 uracil phosphoribosyltransferase [Mycobacterium adipatum]
MSAAATLRSTAEIRARSQHLLTRARDGSSAWFTVHEDAMDAAAAAVADLTVTRFPDLVIPFHSRWRHFEAGGVHRTLALDGTDAAARARAMIDLTVISVLLDAGAGPRWRYREADTGLELTRSEGLGVASWHAFTAGTFSSDPECPLQADAAGLQTLDPERLAAHLQVVPDNPLVGFDGRVDLLRRLGTALAEQPTVYGTPGRPGGLFDLLIVDPAAPTVATHDILSALLSSLSRIWLADNHIDGEPLGDCWRHDAVPGVGATAGWMPFHKLSQWLTYSLLEPFGWAGVQVNGLDALTGLPEYRNGGLFLDTGVLRLREAGWAERAWTPADELVVEWRALTVALLDDLAVLVRERLGVSAQALPLACVLEGGSWAAGRALAQELRGGLPPLTVISDGTVF